MSYWDAIGMGGEPAVEERRLPPMYSGNAEIARAYAIRRARQQQQQGQAPTHSFSQQQPATGGGDMFGARNMMSSWNQNPIPMGAIGNAFMNHGATLGGAMGQLGDQLNRNADRMAMMGGGGAMSAPNPQTSLRSPAGLIPVQSQAPASSLGYVGQSSPQKTPAEIAQDELAAWTVRAPMREQQFNNIRELFGMMFGGFNRGGAPTTFTTNYGASAGMTPPPQPEQQSPAPPARAGEGRPMNISGGRPNDPFTLRSIFGMG